MSEREQPTRRAHRRLPVEMWVEEIRGADRYFQRSANLSLGGIYLDGTIPHPKGTVVQLKFTLPGDSEPIAVRGEIVGDPNEDRLGMNVKFVGIGDDPKLLARLRAFLDRG